MGFVGGDLYVDAIRLDGMQSNAVRGRVVAKSAWLLAEDDCAMRRAPELRLDTQFLFAWFYRIDQLTFNPGAVIFMLGSGAYCAKLDLPNPVFSWHDAVHVLDGRFVAGVLCDGSDDYCWHSPSIIPALKRGRTIYRDGYDIACYPFHQAAQAAMAAGDHRNAYLLHKKSAAIAPAYYEAWFGMGYALLREGAWEQALGVYRKAAALFPKEQTGMINTALNHAALCAAHTRQLGLAIELASMSIEHNQESEYKESEAGKAYRYRAEAYLMSGRVAAAMADLEQALELDRHLESARWLKGLAHDQRNELERANADHAAACRYDKRYAVSYDTRGDTGFLYQADQRVDWDQIDAADIALPARDEAYWLNYMLHDESASLGRVPDAYRSDALCREVVRASGPHKLGYAKYLPDSAFTREIAETLVASSPGWLENIPPRFIDKALVLLARPGTSGFALAQVPAAVIDFDVCVRAVQCGESIASVPPQHVNKALCLACVTAHARRLDEVPPELIDDDLIAAAIAHGEHYGFDHWLPGMYKTRALLELAIGRYKCALDAIPGYRVDGALFAYAEQRYGQDADWPALVARHDCGAIERDPRAKCVTECWSVFWTEPFMLAQIAREDDYLAPYEIPDASFTQAVAEACFERHPVYFYCIPKRFVTAAMSDTASQIDPDQIEHIPVAQRSKAICTRAIKEDAARNLALVPLALRSVKVCVAALLDDGDQRLVPGAIYFEVFDTLIGKHRKQFDLGWLYLNRAEGALRATPRRIELAMEDCQFVLDAHANEEVDEDDLAHARHALALCHYLRGDMALAALWPQTPEQWANDEMQHFAEPLEPVDFDSHRFDGLMEGLDMLVQRRDYRNAMGQVDEVERMLAQAGCGDAVKWAHVLDKKRFVSLELGLPDVNEATCRAAIARLEPETLWCYLPEHDVIRHTLRSCYFRLGTMRERNGMPLAELEADLALVDKALALAGPAEDPSVLDPFREGHAALLGILAAQQPSYKTAYRRAAALLA
ncbi:hypothetical protein F2P44_16800 [Massilia sp. CCM 8695]|uniref:Tetratricopeptide repeat protein n=1 Tax=Massilia frigida TaxID=2609281 RepID=A0ABX0NCD6_9BURK|nr:tetratricopeptide repeat protein [Massilia frigida]NHZ80921.1 hypothetical protein [Massilia frigida]